jgi:CRISPR/Cas system-associated exonuclease Cas4 (RecB family)
MIHEAVIESYRIKPSLLPVRRLTVTSVSECPYETYIHYNKLDPDKFHGDPLTQLNMKNGNWQEREMIEDLRHAGFKLWSTSADKGGQIEVKIGEAHLIGHPDGFIEVSGEVFLLEMKALSLRRFRNFTSTHLEKERSAYVQNQLYLVSDVVRSMGITRSYIYCKCKENNKPYSFMETPNLDFSGPIVEATDHILETNEPPTKLTSERCSNCHHKFFCWGEEEIQLDLSRIGISDLVSLEEKWNEATFFYTYGKFMREEIREFFKADLGEEEKTFQIGNLLIRNKQARREFFDKQRFVNRYGLGELPEVLSEKSYMRVTIRNLEEKEDE